MFKNDLEGLEETEPATKYYWFAIAKQEHSKYYCPIGNNRCSEHTPNTHKRFCSRVKGHSGVHVSGILHFKDCIVWPWY